MKSRRRIVSPLGRTTLWWFSDAVITAGNSDGRNGPNGYHFTAEILSANVRFGSKATAMAAIRGARFTPESCRDES
jgi:hypothetical protein